MTTMSDLDTETGAVDREELARWRRDTPGTAVRVHLNNAGSALPPEAVSRAVAEYLEIEAQIGGYEAAAAEEEAIAATYDAVARLVGAQRDSIALVENATVAFSQALAAIDFEPGDAILTSRVDYPSNQIMYLALAERRGVQVLRAEDLPEGGIDPQSVREHLERSASGRGPRVRLVAVSWIPTNSGLIQEVEAVGEATEEAGVPYMVDACQAVGQMPVDVGRLRCDYLAATGRKFLRAPRGTGFLYVAPRVLERGDYPLTADLRGATWADADRFELAADARRFENWEFSYALVVGLGAAARYALEVGLDEAARRARQLTDLVRRRLRELPHVRVLDPERPGVELAAIATCTVDDWGAEELVERLRELRINTSAFDRSSGVLDMDAKGAASGLRVSPHYYNTAAEVERLAEALGELLGG